MKNTTLILLMLCLFAYEALAQFDSEENQHYFGFFAGGSYQPNGITKLTETIITRDHDKSSFKTKTLTGAGFTGGGAYYFKSGILPWLGFRTEVNYTRYSGGFDCESVPPFDPHKYTMKFRFDYLNIGLGAKLNPWSGLTIGLGGVYGVNLSPDRIDYTHNPDRTIYGNQEAIQNELRRYVHGRGAFGPTVSLGWEFPGGFTIDGQLIYTTTDIIQVDLENSYSYSTTPKNTITAYQLTIGYYFPIGKPE